MYAEEITSELNTKTYKKLYKISKTVAQMMNDRGYGGANLFYEELVQKGFEGYFDKDIKTREQYINNGAELSYPLKFIRKNDLLEKKQEQALVIFRKPNCPIKSNELEDYYSSFNVDKLIVIFPGDPEKDKSLFDRKKDDDVTPIASLIETLKVNNLLEMFNQDDLVFNITKHVLVPKHIPLDDDAKLELLKKYSISINQLPKILLSDPVSKYYGMKRGQVFKIIRDSETAGMYVTYRVVI